MSKRSTASVVWQGADVPLLNSLAETLRNPAFWGYSTWLEIVTRYRKSAFGLLWILVPPALYVGGMGYFFARVQGFEPIGFMLHVGIGYLLFRLMTMVLVDSTSVLPAHAGYILDGRVRLTDFVMRVNFKALFYLATGALVLVPVLFIAPQTHLPGLAASLFGFTVLMLNMAWMSGVVSLFGARYPDTHEFMGNVFTVGFIITPILWLPEHAPMGSWHGLLMRLNPAYHFIELVRAPLMGKVPDPASLPTCLLIAGFGWLLWIWAYRRFARYVALWV